RVARGRALLRDRLTSQGLVLSTAGLASLLLVNISAATVPTALVKTTLKAALGFAAGQAAAALCSAEVASQVGVGLKAMFLTKMKSAPLLVALTVGLAGVGLLARQALAMRGSSPAKTAAPQSAAPVTRTAPEKMRSAEADQRANE